MKKHLMIGLIIFVSIFCLVSCDNHEHDITEVRVDPTCTEEGAVYSTCECGYSNTLVIPALGHHFENGVCSCGEKDPETEKINCALDRNHESCLDPVTWFWDYNKDNWDGKGMVIEIAVDDTTKYDPFLENYSGLRKIERQALLTKIEAEYNIDIVYKNHQNIYSLEINDVKNGSFEIILVDSSWIPTLVKNNSITELYNPSNNTGIFTNYNYVQDETYNLMATTNNKVYGYQSSPLYPDHWLYYNQNLINEYNLADPAELWTKGEWTWSSFKDLLASAKKSFDTANEEKWAFDGEYYEVVKGLVASRGGQMVKDGQVLLDDEIVVEVYEDLREIETLYWYPRNSSIQLGFIEGDSLFHTGKTEYINGNKWRDSKIDFEISIVPYPRSDDDPELKKYKVPYSYEKMFVIPTLTANENGLSESILFNILDDINNGLIPDDRPTAPVVNDKYYNYLSEKITSKKSIDSIMSVVFEYGKNMFYLEQIDVLSATMGEGSHYSLNGIYPQSSIIIVRKNSVPKEILKELQPVYQKQLDEMLK